MCQHVRRNKRCDVFFFKALQATVIQEICGGGGEAQHGRAREGGATQDGTLMRTQSLTGLTQENKPQCVSRDN